MVGRAVTLLKNFPCMGAGEEWHTPWIAWPAEFANAQLAVLVKSNVGAGVLEVIPQSSWDRDQTRDHAGATVTGPGVGLVTDAGDFGPWLRLVLKFSPPPPLSIVVSVFLTPKSE